MAKYDRLLYILNLIRSRKNLNAGMLAGECGVTERTIYRDILALSEANIPIYYDRGYKYASDNFLPPLNFDINEYLTLKTVLDSSPLYGSGYRRRIIKTIKGKIEACLSQAVRRERAFTSDPLRLDIRSTALEEGKERFFGRIETAISEHRIIGLEYESIESGLTDREIEPYFMIFIERAFYFVGYCYLRKGLRTFRLDRIKNIELTGKKFTPRDGIDPTGYFKHSWGVFSGDPVEVEVVFTGKAARVVRFGRHQAGETIEVLADDRVKYRVMVSGIHEICRWLIGFGGEVRVVRPKSLARELVRRAEEILKNNM